MIVFKPVQLTLFIMICKRGVVMFSVVSLCARVCDALTFT